MKKIYTLSAALLCAVTAMGQNLDIETGYVKYNFPANRCGDMPYNNGTHLTVMGRTFQLGDITRMRVSDVAIPDNTVDIQFAGDAATVTIAGNIAPWVDATILDGNVTVSRRTDATADLCGNIHYRASGQSSAGSLTVVDATSATVTLNGLSLTSPKGAALDLQISGKVMLVAADDTDNSLADSGQGSHKGTIAVKGDMALSGNGSITVTGYTSHAIYAKGAVTLDQMSLTVAGAVKDGLNCNKYLTINSGNLTISGTGDDGIQVSFKDDTDRADDDTGTITVNGGTIRSSVSATAAKAIKSDGDFIMTDGTIHAEATGSGKWDATALKTKAATCISADGDMHVSGGHLTLKATAGGGKGISIDGNMHVTGGIFDINTSGGILAYVNSTLYDNYTGNTDRLDSDYKSSPKGIKADGNITIDAGTFNVTTTGNGAEGIESKSVMTINGGTFVLNTRDDALNSSSHMYINGGDITAIATGNDAIDSNGDLHINGGYIRAFGAGAPECGIDANEEEGYTVYFTGGTLLAVGGGNNSTPTNSNSTQAYVTFSGSLTAGSTVAIQSGSQTLASFIVPDNYVSTGGGTRPGFAPPGGPGGDRPGGQGSGSMLITCPGLVTGSSYTITCGSSTSTSTATLYGTTGGRP